MTSTDTCICLSCLQTIVADSPTIKCTSCGNVYHAGKCAGITKTSLKALSELARDSWTCPTCQIHAKQKARTSNPEPTLAQILQEIKLNGCRTAEVLDKVTNLEVKFEALCISHNELKKQVDSNTDALHAAETRVAKLEIELTGATKEVLQLRSVVNDLEQYERRANLEIRGLVEQESEDIYKVINRIATFLEVPELSKADIEAVHRLPSKQGHYRPVIIRFRDRSVRDLWLSKRNMLKAKPRDDEDSFFICENLAAYNKSLLWETRQVAKEKHYSYVWVKNGHILVRKSDGDKPKKIRGRHDLTGL